MKAPVYEEEKSGSGVSTTASLEFQGHRGPVCPDGNMVGHLRSERRKLKRRSGSVLLPCRVHRLLFMYRSQRSLSTWIKDLFTYFSLLKAGEYLPTGHALDILEILYLVWLSNSHLLRISSHRSAYNLAGIRKLKLSIDGRGCRRICVSYRSNRLRRDGPRLHVIIHGKKTSYPWI